MYHADNMRPSTSVITDASAPKAPPVSQSGPLTVPRTSDTPASVPETSTRLAINNKANFQTGIDLIVDCDIQVPIIGRKLRII